MNFDEVARGTEGRNLIGANAVERNLQPPKNAPKDKHNVHDARVLVCCGPGWTPLKTQMCSVFPDRRQTAVPFSYVTG